MTSQVNCLSKIELSFADCRDAMSRLPEKSVNQIFADPSYNLSGKTYVTTKSGKPAQGYKGEWDIVENYLEFTEEWIKEAIRILKDDGTIWISGTLHNHPIVGTTLKKLGMWIINDIIWFKPNATPQLRPVRFAPSTELIWFASKSKKYYFDYKLAKEMNGGKQMRNLWQINASRHITNHPTEKPLDLMDRIVKLGSKANDIVLDPFMGSGTTGVICKKLHRNFIGIESDFDYYKMAKERIDATTY